MYQASAKLQRHLCDVYGITRDRNHIIGHNEWQNQTWVNWMSNNYPAIDPTCNTHTDPGQYWDWNHFMALINGAPGIIRQPWSQVVEPGTNATFTALTTNQSPVFYQWQKNGANIAGATGSSYTISNVQSSNAAGYSVVITNNSGAITSRVARLTVSPVWTVAFSDNFETNSAGLWNLFWGAGNGISDFTTNWGFDYGTNKYVANGLTNTMPSAPNSGGTTHGLKITVNKNDANPATTGVSLYPKNLSFSNSYALRFDMWINYNGVAYGGVGSTEYASCGLNHTGTRVNWTTGSTSSDGFWFAVDGEGGSGASDYRAYLGNGGAPTQLSFASSGLATNGATLDNVSNPFWQDLFPSPAYESAGVPGKHWVQCELSQIANMITWQINGVVVAQRANTSPYTSGDVMIGYFDPFSSIASPLEDNYVIFDNVRVMVPAVAPSITSQPLSQTVTQGVNVSFTVGASGTGPLGYQWRFGGTNIGGANGSSYTRNSVQAADAGNYSVVVSNAAGVVTSGNAALAVLVPPTIAGQPQSQTVTQGVNVIFNVSAGGTTPLGYQWRLNGAPIAGATSATYARTNVQTADAGNYSVMVTNVAGSTISLDAALTVLVPPSISTQPQSQTVKAGSNVAFSVVASGTLPLGFQWRLNGTNLAGASQSSYMRANVQTNDAGDYSVVVTNVAGLATSSNASLNVLPLLPLQFDLIALQPGNQVRLVLSGENGSYAVLWASNFADWLPFTNVAISNGPVEFLDDSGEQAQRFYRASPVP
jgi:hypothetical protein